MDAVPLLRSRLRWLNSYPYHNLAGLKFTRECLHKLQTHPWLKGRHTLSFSEYDPQYPPVQFSATPRCGPAQRRDTVVNGTQQEERCQQKADKNHKQTFLVELLRGEDTSALLCL